jgi:hypothetical protein
MRLLVLIGGLMVLAVGPVAAQTPECPTSRVTHQDFWCRPLKQIVELANSDQPGTDREIERIINISGPQLRAFLLYTQARNQSLDLRLIEDARIDKQVGAPGGSPNSASAVSKGSVPGILGFAVENGALTQSADGSKVTLRGNLVGWLDLIENQGFIASYQDDSRFVRALRRVSYSFTLNTDTTSTTIEAEEEDGGGFSLDAIKEQFRETRQQLDNYSVRVAILDRRDPRSTQNRDAAAKVLNEEGRAVLRSDNFLGALRTSDFYQNEWLQATVARLNDPGITFLQAERVLYQQLDVLYARLIDTNPNLEQEVASGLKALEAFDDARKKLFEVMQKRPLIAFEYVNARAKDLPNKSTLRFIAEGQFGDHLDLTGNVAWTLQRQATVQLPEPVTLDNLRDFTAAVQLDVPITGLAKRLSSFNGIGAPIFGVAYLSQKLTKSAAISFVGHEFTVEPGWIHAVQAKVTVPVKGSGVKMPLSVTWANRDELIKEKTIRGQLGLTFDLDVLTSAIRR